MMLPIRLTHIHGKINCIDGNDVFSMADGVTFHYKHIFYRKRLIKHEPALNKAIFS